MTSLSNEILEKYQVRKSKKQKLAFISLLQKHFPQLSVEASGFPKSRNLVVGNIEQAKVVLTAHYDTSARSPVPNFMIPQKPVLSLLISIVMILPFLLAVLLLRMLLERLALSPQTVFLIVTGFYTLFIFLLLYGPANKHTANDNTSGVIVLCELLQSMSDEELSKTAFVFFDNEESGLVGSSRFRSKYKKVMKDKLLINFDCVSDGSNILIATSKKARTSYENLIKSSFSPTDELTVIFEKLEKVMYPSDQAGFKTAVAIAALKHKRFLGYYMDRIHTPKDTIFEERNISYLKDCVQQLIKAL